MGTRTDTVIEAATVFLYDHMARDIFGPRFAAQLRELIRPHFKFSSPEQMEERLSRIAHNVAEFRRFEDAWNLSRSPHADFTRHVRSAIRALLAEGGFAFDDPAVVKDTFPRFEDAARQVRSHLLGIKQQSHYVMK